MAATAERTDPKLWDDVKARITEGEKGGNEGEWSARKAQLAVAEYKKAGGAYKGQKSPDNHLAEWTHEDWGTKSGHPSHATGERYLPKVARDALSPSEYRRTTAKKRADTRAGQQFSPQPKDVAQKAAIARHATSDTKAALLQHAAARGIRGRTKMSKAQLAQALYRR